MSKPIISGIQQMGIGIPNVYEAWAWYRQHLGMDIPMFDEAAEANLMLPYTDNQPQERHAILAINIQGGGGLEIWQYTGRTPQPPAFEIQLGDLGLSITKFKTKNVQALYAQLKADGVELLSPVSKNPAGEEHFFARDPYGNILEIVPGGGWFHNTGHLSGGVYGAVIGVSDIEKAKVVYSDILGYDKVIYDEEGSFDDLGDLPGGKGTFRRVLLEHTEPRKGPFSKVLGPSVMELITVKDRSPKKIYQDRLWGDLGFIHLCFDINGMAELRQLCADKGIHLR